MTLEQATAIVSERTGLTSSMARRLLLWWKDCRAEGIRIRINSTLRSTQRQQELYDAWVKRGKTGHPVAKPGTSKHEKGKAVDANIIPADQLHRAVQLSKRHGLTWGGEWKGRSYDPVHWQEA